MTFAISVLVLFGSVGAPGDAYPSRSVERFALVIGENRPLDDETPPLTYADDDAVLTSQLLTEAGVRVELLVSLDAESQRLFDRRVDARTPTRARLEASLDELRNEMTDAKRRGSHVEFLFVYSGHGDVAYGEGYVAIADDRISRSFLYEVVLGRSPADRNHVIIDACRSYFLVFGRGPGGERVEHRVVIQNARERFPNTGFVLSTSSDRDSHEWGRFGAGIFNYEVRSALRGGADANLDGRISYSEVGAFIETANESIDNPRYRPDAVLFPPRVGDEPLDTLLLEWPAESERLSVPPPSSLGHMYLEDDRGIRLGDVHPDRSQALLLHVPSSRPLFLRHASEEREYVLVERGSRELAPEDQRAASVTRKGAAHLVFRSLFEEPFAETRVLRFSSRYSEPQPWLTIEAPPPRPALKLKRVTPWITGASALVGVAFTTVAAVERSSASQADAQAVNDRIDVYNGISIAAYSTAGVALFTWLGLTIWGPDEP